MARQIITINIRTTNQKPSWPGAKPCVIWCLTMVDVQRGPDLHAEMCRYASTADTKVEAEGTVKRHRAWHRENPGTAWSGGDV